MLFALDKNGNKTHIDCVKRSIDYYCPCCGSELILKLGDIRIHHFSHPCKNVCKDTWHYDMSDWHYAWQNKFPQEYQEVVKTFNGKTHRADVLIEEAKIVFEFQHSSLSSEEFEERNTFYNDLGYKVIWVFDEEEQFIDNRIDNYKSNLWSWKRPRKTFNHFNAKNKNVEVYLQLENRDSYLVKVTWCTNNNGLSRFATDGFKYDDESLINLIDKKLIEEKKEIKLSELYDKLIELNSKDHTTYYFGCPLSTTHKCANSIIDIPENRYFQIMPCMKCKFQCESYIKDELICKKRFLDLKLDANTIVRIESKDKNGFINKISYLENGKRIFINMVTFEQNYSKNIFVLWEENDCSIATFRNIKTGKYIRLYNNPREQYLKYKKVYGCFSSNKYSFSKKKIELFDVEKNVWVLDWCKKTLK